MSGQRGGHGGWSWAEGWRLTTGAGSGEPWRGGVLSPAAAFRSSVVSGKRADPIGTPGGTERREQDGRGRQSRGTDCGPGPPALAVVGARRDARAV